MPKGSFSTGAAAKAAAFQPTDEQDEILAQFTAGKDIAIQAGAGCGKALRNDQPVLTAEGWSPIGKLKIGDYIVGSDGRYYPVTGIFPQGEIPLVEIHFTGRTKVVASLDHLWACATKKERDRKKLLKIRTTAEIMRLLERPQTRSIWLPMISRPVDGFSQKLPIHPWLLGVLLGDGSFAGKGTVLSNADAELLCRVKSLLPEDVTLNYTGGVDWRLSTGPNPKGKRPFNPITTALRELGLQRLRGHEKYVPAMYLQSPFQDRLALLQGLMDTDGYGKEAACEYVTTSLSLSQDVKYIVESLGGLVTTKIKFPTCQYKGQTSYGLPCFRLFIRMPGHLLPFSLSRKTASYAPKSKYQPARRIVKIVQVAAAQATCISVASPDSLFLTAGCIPTHNTRTLQLIGESTKRKGQFTAFNKQICVDASTKMPSNIKVNTLHSLAHASHGWKYAHRFKAATPKLSEVATRLKTGSLSLDTPFSLYKKLIEPWKAVSFCRAAVLRFCQSADKTLETHHFPYVDGIDAPGDYTNNDLIRSWLLEPARRMWADWKDPKGYTKYDMAGYLKLWELSGPKINADFILIDEAQDVSGVMISVIEQQADCQKVWVGDAAQSINEWNGAINALGRVKVTSQGQLSHSFRFGPPVAEVANRLLGRLAGVSMRLTGSEAVDSYVRPIARPRAILSRTNASAVAGMLVNPSKSFLIGGTTEIIKLVEELEKLKGGTKSNHHELIMFDDWDELSEYIGTGHAKDLELMVSLVSKHGGDRIAAALRRMPPMDQAETIYSTTHKVKGLEFETVRLADDFTNALTPRCECDHTVKSHMFGECLGCKDDGKTCPHDPPKCKLVKEAEVKLVYVGVTRAQKGLDISGLVGLV